MKLESCYITGFGRLSDRSFTFEPGLNEILEENGWGKTTFAVFLKAMFYGIPYSRKHGLSEREHYKPWNGDVYGGSLTFSMEGKTYRVERTFGKKDTDDTFRLIDANTNLESSDFSSNLGEEIFGVDRDSYEKSIFVPQNRLDAQMTSSLNAKMGDLQKAQDDITHFDEAVKLVEEARKLYTSTGSKNPGKLLVIREEIRDCKQKVEDIPTLTTAYEQKKELLENRRLELKSLEEKRAVLREKINERAKREQELGALRAKLEQLKKDKERLNALDDFFVRGIPTEEEFERAEELDRSLQLDQEMLLETREKLPEAEEAERLSALFEEGVPTEEQQNVWKNQAEQLTSLRALSSSVQMTEVEKRDLLNLKEYFANSVPSEERKKEVQEAEQKLLGLAGEKKQLEGNVHQVESRYETVLEEAREKGNGPLIFAIIMAIIFFVAGVVFSWLLRRELALPVGLSCVLVAIIILFVALFTSARKKRALRLRLQKIQDRISEEGEKLAALETEEEELRQLGIDFLNDYPGEEEDVLNRIREVQSKQDRFAHLKELEEKMLDKTSEAVEQISEIQVSLYTALQRYAESYGADLYHEMNEQEVLNRLERDGKKEVERLASLDVIHNLEERIQEKNQELTEFLDRFPKAEGDEEQDRGSRIAKIRSDAHLYNNLTEDARKLAEELKDSPVMNESSQERPIEELQNEREELDQQIEELNRYLPRDAEEVSDVAEQLVAYEEERDHLVVLEEREKEMKNRLDVLTKTADYLKLAREKFLLRYMKPLQDGMKKYLAMLRPDQEQAEVDFTLDMDLSIHLNHRGQTKSAEYLSAGFQDLTSLCARFALVDVLYHKESPTVILDDPFTNLDEPKIQAGAALLEKLAEEKQIIYFTCHESRSVK